MTDIVAPTAPVPASITPDWADRRRVIFVSLWFCAVCAGLIIGSACAVLIINIIVTVSLDANLLGLLGSALYTIAFVATSIIGSYVFGVNFDWANTRQHIVDMINTTNSVTVSPASTATPTLTRTARGRFASLSAAPDTKKAP